jgi:hypothetical protein
MKYILVNFHLTNLRGFATSLHPRVRNYRKNGFQESATLFSKLGFWSRSALNNLIKFWELRS